MPSIAQSALLQRLHESGALARLQSDFFVLTGIRLDHFTSDQPSSASKVFVPLKAGACDLGWLACALSKDSEKNGAMARLLAGLAEALTRELIDPSGANRWVALPAAVERASKILRSRFQEPLRLSSVAEEIGVSGERLSRLFHASLGITFSDYLNRVRLARCRQLLRNPAAQITEVAFESGFQSLSQFNRRFKASEGISPSTYQRRVADADHDDAARAALLPEDL
ncbi:helix-turn-helix transcriptional regulator [Haloferula sp.]|uniref:helix-turn-helix transcriptional regulator n=1 Tax=Haloferula sp. TaxID=2497595 RepID=UPI003C728977